MAKELSGSLRKNPRKTTDKHPDVTGSCMIGGIEYWISGWRRRGDDGEPWSSLSFKPKQERPSPAPPESTEPPGADDDVPF